MRSDSFLFALVVAGLTMAMVSHREASAFVRPAPPPGFERNGNGGWTYKPPAPVRPGSGGLLPGGKLSIPKPGGGFGSVGIGFKPTPGGIGRAIGGFLRRNPAAAVGLGLAGWLADECLKNRGGQWMIACGPDPDIDWGLWEEPYRHTQHGSANAACRAGAMAQSGNPEVAAGAYAKYPNTLDDKTSPTAFCCYESGACPFYMTRTVIGDPAVIDDDKMDEMLERAPIRHIPPIPVEVEPIINPSPGPDPKPLPFRMPIGDPVPRVDPDTGEQRWVQPGLELQQLGTAADPLRLDARPIETPVESPSGERPTDKPAEPKPGEKPVPGGGAKPDQPDIDVCKKNPEILACQKLGEIESIKLDDQSVHMDIRPYGSSSAGSCPAPRQASFFGRPLTISYQPLCDFASMIRPMVVGLAWLSVALIFVGAARRS